MTASGRRRKLTHNRLTAALRLQKDRYPALRRGARLAAGLFLCGLPGPLGGVVFETSTCGSPREIAGSRDPWRCCGSARGRDRALRLPVTRLRPPTSAWAHPGVSWIRSGRYGSGTRGKLPRPWAEDRPCSTFCFSALRSCAALLPKRLSHKPPIIIRSSTQRVFMTPGRRQCWFARTACGPGLSIMPQPFYRADLLCWWST
jgi:hypothetical protein